MPSILEELLEARKKTKLEMKNEKDSFKEDILDKRQLSIKITANSLYGQTGAKTSTFYNMDVAASTTAMGRKLLINAREVIESCYKNRIIDSKYGKIKTNAEYIYGDTDSVFFTFNLTDIDNNIIKDKKALELTIELAKEAGKLTTKFLNTPHELEYEKTFMPFCLLSKKRYVGMLYEDDPNHCKRKSMGIVLKRRDNAPIVKDIYGGIIDILMKDKDVDKSIKFLHTMLSKLLDEKINIDKLTLSKSLRGLYKNPNQIAHNILAQRIGMRDPGNKPLPGDRVPYVYIVNKKSKLQGECIENPKYILDNKLKIDYQFYITNQIMKPVIQLYSLVVNQMKYRGKISNNIEDCPDLVDYKSNNTYEQYIKFKQKKIEKIVEDKLFKHHLLNIKNKNNNQNSLLKYFK